MPDTYISPAETGFYYLNSRYYDPEIGRFVNGDGVVSGTSDSVQGYNVFVYCDNNPVNNFDPTGYWKLPNWAKIAIGAVATVAAVGITVATGGAVAPLLIGVVASTLSGAAMGYVTGGKQGMIDGAVDSFMWGGIGALGSSLVSAAPKAVKLAKTAKSDPIKKAFKQLDSSGLRPGQTTISRTRVMELVDNFDPVCAESRVYSNGGTRFLVDGHHTTVASTILGKGNTFSMGIPTTELPSATNVYWTKRWYEFGKTVIKLID